MRDFLRFLFWTIWAVVSLPGLGFMILLTYGITLVVWAFDDSDRSFILCYRKTFRKNEGWQIPVTFLGIIFWVFIIY